MKIFKPQVFPQIWEGGIPRWEGGTISTKFITFRKMVWTPTRPNPFSTPSAWDPSVNMAGGGPGEIGWEPAEASYHAWSFAALGLATENKPVPCRDRGQQHSLLPVLAQSPSPHPLLFPSLDLPSPLPPLNLSPGTPQPLPACPDSPHPHLLLSQLWSKPAWTLTLAPEDLFPTSPVPCL